MDWVCPRKASWYLILIFLLLVISFFMLNLEHEEYLEFVKTEKINLHLSPDVEENQRILIFPVCNGFINQQLSILHGLILAIETKRTTVLLPNLGLNGEQFVAINIIPNNSNSVPFSYFYDEFYFTSRINSIGFNIQTEENLPKHLIENIPLKGDFVKTIREGTSIVQIDCPLLMPDRILLQKHKKLIPYLLSSLIPSPKWKTFMNSEIRTKLPENFNMLHYRAENDWVTHCEKWILSDPKTTCFNNTDRIHLILNDFGIAKNVTLVFASEMKPENKFVFIGLDMLKRDGFNIISQEDLFLGCNNCSREVKALLMYYLAKNATKFIGNSASTFSALTILNRRNEGLWAAYYNGGNIPLSFFMPDMEKFPWVFSYSSLDGSYNGQAHISLISGIKNGNLKPYCLYFGNLSGFFYDLLVANNVVIINRTPEWKKNIQPINKALIQYSPLYGSLESVVVSLSRIDIPVLSYFSQYTYLLYTDVDTFFRKPLNLYETSFGSTVDFPKSIAKTIKVRNRTFNNGVMIMYLPEMRKTYKNFTEFIFVKNPSLYFGKFGPLEQGAYNEFYQIDINSTPLSGTFVDDYLKLGINQTSYFGVKHSLCRYIDEILLFVQENNITYSDTHKLVSFCSKS